MDGIQLYILVEEEEVTETWVTEKKNPTRNQNQVPNSLLIFILTVTSTIYKFNTGIEEIQKWINIIAELKYQSEYKIHQDINYKYTKSLHSKNNYQKLNMHLKSFASKGIKMKDI